MSTRAAICHPVQLLLKNRGSYIGRPDFGEIYLVLNIGLVRFLFQHTRLKLIRLCWCLNFQNI